MAYTNYQKRRIKLTIKLGLGSYGESGEDTVILSGYRCSATITKAGNVMAELSLRVFGLSLDIMNKLTILGAPPIDNRNNTITVEAGTDDDGLAVVYQGTIAEGWMDPNGMPDVAFVIMARTNGMAAFKPMPPTSYKGSVEIALAFQGFATQLGLRFENSGVSGVIANPYFHGELREQIRQLAETAHCAWTIDSNTLAVWVRDGSRSGDQIPIIAADTGMVGSPVRTQDGFTVKSLFNPSIQYGSSILVESLVTQANGIWAVFSLVHDLESEVPGGKWFTTIDCNLLGKGGAS